MARGAGCGAVVGAAAQAARERARRALADARHLCRRAASRTGPQLPLSDQQMAQQQDELAGRPARAAARRGHRGAFSASAKRRPSVPAEPRRVANPRVSALHNKPFPLQGIKILDFAWFLASAGGTRFLGGDGRGELQGRVEGQSRHAAGGDGAGRRPRRARRRDRPVARVSGTRTWAASSTTRMPASAASR